MRPLAVGPRGLEEANDGHGGDGLAAAGFADDGEHFAGSEGEAEIADGSQGFALTGKRDVQIADVEQGWHGSMVSADKP